MKRKLHVLFLLIIFVFGLVPGDYWKIFHTHKHTSLSYSQGLKISVKQKLCTSQIHLYDYTPSIESKSTRFLVFLSTLIEKAEVKLPHPGFLNHNLRAPPKIS